MDNTQLLEELTTHVSKLHALLRDPQPGLFTWCSFVGQEWKAIARLWGGEQQPEQGREIRTSILSLTCPNDDAALKHIGGTSYACPACNYTLDKERD